MCFRSALGGRGGVMDACIVLIRVYVSRFAFDPGTCGHAHPFRVACTLSAYPSYSPIPWPRAELVREGWVGRHAPRSE